MSYPLEMLDKIRQDQQVAWQTAKDFGLSKNINNT